MRQLPTHIILDDLFKDLTRFAIGFEPMLTRINNVNVGQNNGYPPYNLDCDGDTYRLELAVAGFKLDELSITLNDDRILSVKGSKQTDNTARTWLHRGIAARDFERQFTLAEHIKITSAKLEDGLLVIELYREIPESAKTRNIPISNGNVLDVNVSTPDN